VVSDSGGIAAPTAINASTATAVSAAQSLAEHRPVGQIRSASQPDQAREAQAAATLSHGRE